MKVDPIGRVSNLQDRFNKTQMSDIQETNRVVRLAEAHTDHALPVCKIPINHICFVSYGDASGGSTRAEQAQAGYVVMIADQAFLEGMAAHMTLVSRRSHRVKRVEASASVAKAICLSEAIAQGDWIRKLWSEVVLGLSLRERREQEHVPPLISVTDSKGNTITSTTGQSVPAKTGGVLLIWTLSEKTYSDHERSCAGWMERLKEQMP